MGELRAEPLSPIDAATLWPQLPRLNTEVVAVRAGENLLIASGLAATGLTRLPRVPRTIVLGVKRGLGYRGVLVARELAGGAAWEAVSLRIQREKDDEAVTALLGACGYEVARRAGRSLFLRESEGSPHAQAVRRGGLMPYLRECLFALPNTRPSSETPFRPAARADRHGIFRLYCRAVPEVVRRFEAPTQQDWRAIHDSYDCEKEFVLEREGTVAGWAGLSGREARILIDSSGEVLADAALDLVEAAADREAALVLGEGQEDVERLALARGYTGLGVRLVCARRLAALNSLKEVVAVPAQIGPVPP